MTGDFSVTIKNISKDKKLATHVKRDVKSFQQAIIHGITDDINVLSSTMEWRLISETEQGASESVEGKLVSQGTPDWTINKRTIPAGIYQVKFLASFSVGDSAFPNTLNAFDYGFIKVIAAPVRAIIDGGSSVRWGSKVIVTVDGSLSYDVDIGPGNHTGLNFTWTCLGNASWSKDCFGSFVGEVNSASTAVSIDPGRLAVGKSYVLRLNVSKDIRSSFAEMSFEIAAGVVPQVKLR